jgi:23S rRNA pseudouridine2605 synthase
MSSYLLLNKPKGVITSMRGGAGRRTVLDFIPFALRPRDQSGQRWHSVGLLDGDSTGLVLLTDDAELARQLEHPKLGVLKEYRALCTGLADDEQLRQLRAGMYLVNPTADGGKTTQRAAMESVRILKRLVDRARGDRTLLGLSVREGEPREIRRMLARVGLKLRELERVAIGPVRAPGLKPGATKLLGKKDVEKLRAAVL